jgi:hypothetical protein
MTGLDAFLRKWFSTWEGSLWRTRYLCTYLCTDPAASEEILMEELAWVANDHFAEWNEEGE